MYSGSLPISGTSTLSESFIRSTFFESVWKNCGLEYPENSNVNVIIEEFADAKSRGSKIQKFQDSKIQFYLYTELPTSWMHFHVALKRELKAVRNSRCRRWCRWTDDDGSRCWYDRIICLNGISGGWAGGYWKLSWVVNKESKCIEKSDDLEKCVERDKSMNVPERAHLGIFMVQVEVCAQFAQMAHLRIRVAIYEHCSTGCIRTIEIRFIDRRSITYVLELSQKWGEYFEVYAIEKRIENLGDNRTGFIYLKQTHEVGQFKNHDSRRIIWFVFSEMS
ncbi:hypothetical protein WN51_05455 [Melipona quadrifasciata]|uniref:Uncharacterized protein n=1 Tax=Melipona quadrifasciata TaxID=166423 RepID=A0A0M9AAM7_9HYME|nr:hypothetical protein WN51_05455 [Melipona quadrifasciata]